MLRRVGVALVVTCVALLGMSVPAQAATATTVSGWSTTATTGAVGYVIKDAVTVKTGSGYVARSVSLQRRPSTSSTWSTVGTGTTTSAGAYTASYTVPAVGVYYFRLYVKATSNAASATTGSRKVTGITGATTTVSGWATTATSGAVGYVINDAVSVKTGSGYVARSVTVQRRPSTSSTWSTVGTGTTSSAGAYTASYTVPATGVYYFRLVVPATATAAAATTSSRTVTGITGAATAVSGWETTATTTAVTATLTNAVTVKTGISYVARSVSVQRRPSTSSTWSTVITGTTSTSGAYTASYAAPAAGVWFFRLYVPPTATAAATTTADRQVTAVPAPTVTSISPTSGTTSGGTVVTITGTNLTGTTSVSFGGTAGIGLTVNSATSVTVTAPAHADGVVSVSVTTPGGASNTLSFTYTAPPAVPAISVLSPAGGTTSGGTVVTITGTNLTGTTGVSFGGVAGTNIQVNDATSVTVTSPSHVAGAVPVTLTTAAGTSSAMTYLYSSRCAAPYAPVLHVSGTLTEDTTWSADCVGVYVVDSAIDIPAGRVLAVGSGWSVPAFVDIRIKLPSR